MVLGENCKKLITFIDENKDNLRYFYGDMPELIDLLRDVQESKFLDTQSIQNQMISKGNPIMTSEFAALDLLEKYELIRKKFKNEDIIKLIEMYNKCKSAQESSHAV